MQAKVESKVAPTRDYQDYAPATEFVEEEDCDTLLIYVPGFKKEQLRVQLTPTPTLKISGECHIGDNKWSRFEKEYPVSTKCETNKITAKFDVGILYIRQPKSITPVVEKDGEKPVITEAQKAQKNENKPPLPQTTEMKKASKQKDESKSGEKMEDEDKSASKSEEADKSDVTQKSREEEQKKGGVENDVTGKRKRVDEFETEDYMTSRVKIVKKVGRMMSIVVVVLSAIVLGIYVKNLLMPAGDYKN